MGYVSFASRFVTTAYRCVTTLIAVQQLRIALCNSAQPPEINEDCLYLGVEGR